MTKTIKVTPEEISAARALVAINGESNVSDVVVAVAKARPGHPVLLKRSEPGPEPIEATG